MTVGSWRGALDAVGVVRSSRDAAVDDRWDGESVSIQLLPPHTARALAGLDEFSHVVVVYVFDRVDVDQPVPEARRPKGNPEWPEVGIFAQRAKDRPNRIGVSTCRLLGVDGTTLRVEGLDAIDGTPVLDLKPHMIEFGARGAVRQPAWATELMRDYF